MLGGGEMQVVEAVTAGGMAKDLDALAGIDAWHICRDGGGIRGIASRVQSGNKAWNTFTIRYSRVSGAETEFTKRTRALVDTDRGWLYPHLTAQAYVNESRDELLSCAVVRTRDLYTYASNWLASGTGHCELKPNPADGNWFIAVKWDGLQKDGIDVRYWVQTATPVPAFS